MCSSDLVMLILIYAALAIPLKSYGQPLIIMAVIPFGVVGAFIGHLIFGLPISVIYAFARHADDIADEGILDDQQRLVALEQYQAAFETALAESYSSDPVLFALTDVIKAHQLPVALFLDLLTAFKMDTKTKRYQSFEDILNYCKYSANPIGRLLLHLHKQNTAENLINSDSICTALQLINFYQDIQQDYLENNRIYIPVNELSE